MYGKKHTDISRKKIKENHIDVSGSNNPMYGKIQSLEGRDNIRKALIERNGKLFTCIYCNKIIKGIANYKRFHDLNCKEVNKVKKTYKLYLDDIRTPNNSKEWVIVRSYREAVSYIKEHGMPTEFSLDHDLGTNNKGKLRKTGYDFTKWMVYDMKLNLTKIPINVHSANPVGQKNIEKLIFNWNKFVKRNGID